MKRGIPGFPCHAYIGDIHNFIGGEVSGGGIFTAFLSLLPPSAWMELIHIQIPVQSRKDLSLPVSVSPVQHGGDSAMRSMCSGKLPIFTALLCKLILKVDLILFVSPYILKETPNMEDEYA